MRCVLRKSEQKCAEMFGTIAAQVVARTLKTNACTRVSWNTPVAGRVRVCVCVYAASWAAFCFSMVNQGSPSRDWVHHEISPADIPAFLSIYKDLYERAMDTLSSLSPPPPTRDQPRGGPRGPGSTSLWPRERENKAWSRQAWGVEGGGVEDPGRWGPTKGNRRGSARRASGLRVFGT